MEWIADPTVWVGLLTLVALEIVLGVDNLIFIAILADKLPPQQRDRARVIGLSLALVMRLAAAREHHLGDVAHHAHPELLAFRDLWRDLILIVGGVFLLIKATTEIHDRLEERPQARQGGQARPSGRSSRRSWCSTSCSRSIRSSRPSAWWTSSPS